MDQFLSLIGVQAMKYAIRSGIALTSTYALKHCSTLLKSVEDKCLHEELESLQRVLEDKIKIITPAIDLIELKSGRGNNILESAVPLTKSIHSDIIRLGRQIESAIAPAPSATSGVTDNTVPIEAVLSQMKRLLGRIDSNIPLLQLVIAASGESLSTSLPPSISPSRLLQASTFLTVGDTRFAANPAEKVQIGPEYLLSVYMLFSGHSSRVYSDQSAVKKPTWKEVIHKARVQLYRTFGKRTNYGQEQPEVTNNIPEFTYILEINEDKDDGRVHEGSDTGRCSPRSRAISESVPIRQITKTFYANSGKILNLSEDVDGANNPVLLLKRDMEELDTGGQLADDHDNDNDDGALDDQDEQSCIDLQLLQDVISKDMQGASNISTDSTPIKFHQTSFPASIDHSWIAFEVFEQDHDEDETSTTSDDEPDDTRSEVTVGKSQSTEEPLRDCLIDQLSGLSVESELQQDYKDSPPKNSVESLPHQGKPTTNAFAVRSPFHAVTTSLSLLEMMIRLAGLQEFQQTSHLSIPDHILSFFLEEASTTGLTGERKWRAAAEARACVGFDPYSDTADAGSKNGINGIM